MKQAITLRGKILESLPLTIVMVNGFVWKPANINLFFTSLLGEQINPTGYCPIDRGSEVPTV